jgi:hypothetical protein
MSVGFAAITGGICHRSLEPGFGTTVVITAVITTRFFTLDVARRTVITAVITTRFFTLDVARRTVITAVIAAGAVLRAVGRCMSGFLADAAVLIEEGRANDFAIRAWLVFDIVAGVFG